MGAIWDCFQAIYLEATLIVETEWTLGKGRLHNAVYISDP
jgi:hypothetical protein